MDVTCIVYTSAIWKATRKGISDNLKNRNLKEYSVIFTTSFMHKSEDINKKSLFPKFQLIPILRFQVMHDYVCFIASIDYCVE